MDTFGIEESLQESSLLKPMSHSPLKSILMKASYRRSTGITCTMCSESSSYQKRIIVFAIEISI